MFAARNKKALSLYVMSDFPNYGDTVNLCIAAQQAGVDFLEIGMPFSDPIADGPTIQRCSEVALKNGFSIEGLFKQLKSVRAKVSIPLILMGYLNPVLQFGIERFCQQAQAVGVDGVILPDLPVEEYLADYQGLFKQHGLQNIFLITARTAEERIRLLDQHSEAFLYLVSSEATTGGTLALDSSTTGYFERISRMQLKSPLIVGFGISDYKSYQAACHNSAGAIVASAFLRRLEQHGTSADVVTQFVKEVREG